MINKNPHHDIYQHEQNLRNKEARYVLSRNLFAIKKYKIEPTKPRPTEDNFYELIKDIASSDKQFQKFSFDSYRIRICYNKEKDSFYLECYSY